MVKRACFKHMDEFHFTMVLTVALKEHKGRGILYNCLICGQRVFSDKTHEILIDVVVNKAFVGALVRWIVTSQSDANTTFSHSTAYFLRTGGRHNTRFFTCCISVCWYVLEMARPSTFSARTARSSQETARPGPFMLNYNLFSGPDQPVTRNMK